MSDRVYFTDGKSLFELVDLKKTTGQQHGYGIMGGRVQEQRHYTLANCKTGYLVELDGEEFDKLNPVKIQPAPDATPLPELSTDALRADLERWHEWTP